MHYSSVVGFFVLQALCPISQAAGPTLSPSPLPQQAVPAHITLGALDTVLTALTDSLPMRTAVTSLRLQAQRLSSVARAEFAPKLGISGSTLNNATVVDGSGQTLSAQNQVALDLNWRLRTGANVKLSNGLTSNVFPGQLAQSGRTQVLSLTQPLLKGAGRLVTEAGLMGAESNYRVSAKALVQTAKTLVVQALGAYIAVQQAQAATQQARAAHALAQRLHAFNGALVSTGRLPSIVLLQSEADVSRARLGIAQADNTERQAVRTLARAMGQSNRLDGVELVLPDTFADGENNNLPGEQALVNHALQASAELFAAREAVTQAELALVMANDGLLPSLALTVASTRTLGSNIGAAAGANAQGYSIGLGFEYSFDRAALKLDKSTAQTNLDTARTQLVLVEQQVKDTAIDALRNLMFAHEQRGLALTALTLATQQLDAEVTRQSLGRASQLELTNAQQSLAASNRQLLDAAQQVFRSRVELEQIDGSLLKKWGVESMVEGWLMHAQREVEP